MAKVKLVFTFLVIIVASNAHTTQRPGGNTEEADDFNPFLELASALGGQGGGGGAGALGGVVSILGNLMQNQDSGKANGNNIGSIISGIGSLFANSNSGRGNGGGGGFDPSIIGNVIEMFASSNNDNGNQQRSKRSTKDNNGPDWESLLDLASTFLGSQSNEIPSQKKKSGGEGLMSLLPMVMQVVNSFSSPEGEKINDRHKDHAWILPPFLEKIHVMWDHFTHSELAEVLWLKSGLNQVFKGFTDREGKMDYGKLFKSLENQSFRRRWIKAATDYLADWANYIANPDVYQRYFTTAHVMANGFLQSQGFPKNTMFDPKRPSETLSNMVDHAIKKHLNAKVSSITYIKPAVTYVKELLKLGHARGLILQKFNATDLSDKLTDTLNLEVIEPILKVHRAYRFAAKTPHCDKYILCEINSHDPNEKVGLGTGVKTGITKMGSMAASWFISSETGTPFWTLFSVINDPYNCEKRYPSDCSEFHDGEHKVTTEYVHNEL